MRLDCPYCGSRDIAEFTYRGDAAADDPYLRDNPAGPISELWRHARGCRQWLVVRRDTRTHEIFGVVFAREAAR